MLAVGLGADAVQEFLQCSKGLVDIACYNSPNIVTLSGNLLELERIKSNLDSYRHFSRLLQVDLAYHSKFMAQVGNHYENLLVQNCEPPLPGFTHVTMFSLVTGRKMDQSCDARYWKNNMVSPVRFDQAAQEMISGREGADFLIEIGPSGALAGPIKQIKQIKQALTGQRADFQYCAAVQRGPDSIKAIFDVAGRIFTAGGSISLAEVNHGEKTGPEKRPLVIVDLPNYVWNYSTKYWHETEASKDWRFRKFPHHDLLGSKILGTSWNAPSFRRIMRVEDLAWLKDHKVGNLRPHLRGSMI